MNRGIPSVRSHILQWATLVAGVPPTEAWVLAEEHLNGRLNPVLWHDALQGEVERHRVRKLLLITSDSGVGFPGDAARQMERRILECALAVADLPDNYRLRLAWLWATDDAPSYTFSALTLYVEYLHHSRRSFTELPDSFLIRQALETGLSRLRGGTEREAELAETIRLQASARGVSLSP